MKVTDSTVTVPNSPLPTPEHLLERLESFYDAVPRNAARAEEHGSLTLFVREGSGWPFYARPTQGCPGSIQAADVAKVRARQRKLGVPEAFEWVAETSPTMRGAIEEAGLEVHEHPLMVLVAPTAEAAGPLDTDRVSIRVLNPDDPALAAALALPHVAFAEPGTQVGSAGPEELAAAVAQRAGDGSLERTAGRIRGGLAGVAAAIEDRVVLCSGQHNQVGTVSEIVAVGTLPSARRRGLGLAVTRALVDDARSRGVETVFLSADDDSVARLYTRLGFRRVGTALVAEAPVTLSLPCPSLCDPTPSQADLPAQG